MHVHDENVLTWSQLFQLT